MTDKLAEEILSKHLSPEYLALDGNWLLRPCIEAMQAYHEAKIKEVMDADIKAFIDKHEGNTGNILLDKAVEAGFIEGIKVMQNGGIKHIEK